MQNFFANFTVCSHSPPALPDNAPGSVTGYFAFWRLKSYQPTMLTVTVFARYFVLS